MPELPIIVEPTVRSYLLWGGLGVGILLTLIYAVWQQKRRLRDLTVTAIFAFLAFAAFGILLLLQPVGWYWRIDENGMTLHAPFELLRASGSITWAEVTGMHVVTTHGRSNFYNQLEIYGQHGSVIEINGLDTMPKSFAPLLVAVFTHYATHAKLSPDAKGFAESFAAVLGETAAVPGQAPQAKLALSSYRVRVAGRVLK